MLHWDDIHGMHTGAAGDAATTQRPLAGIWVQGMCEYTSRSEYLATEYLLLSTGGPPAARQTFEVAMSTKLSNCL